MCGSDSLTLLSGYKIFELDNRKNYFKNVFILYLLDFPLNMCEKGNELINDNIKV